MCGLKEHLKVYSFNLLELHKMQIRMVFKSEVSTDEMKLKALDLMDEIVGYIESLMEE